MSATPDFAVSPSAIGNHVEPTALALSDGSTLVTWIGSDGGGGQDATLRARMLDEDGNPSGVDFQINTTPGVQGGQPPVVLELGGGKLFFAWDAGNEIRGRIIDTQTAATSEDFVVGSGGDYSAALTENGDVFIVWSAGNLYGRVIDPDDPAADSTFGVSTGQSLDPGENPASTNGAVTTLPDGRVYVSWYYSDLEYQPIVNAYFYYDDERARLFNADGTPASSELTTNGGPNENDYNVTTLRNPVTLSDGRIVSAGNGGILIWDGDPAHYATGISFTPDAANEPDLVELPDGRLFVVWASGPANGDGDGTAIYGRVINLDGTPSPPQFIINDSAAGDQLDPTVTLLPDGQVFVGWDEGPVGQGLPGEIRGRVIDVDDPPPPPLNPAPVAVDDAPAAGGETTARVFDVLANDTDADGDTLEIASISAITGANVTGLGALSAADLAAINAAFSLNGTQDRILFTPGAGLPGTESVFDRLNPGQTATILVTYTVRDPVGHVDQGVLTVKVSGAFELLTGGAGSEALAGSAYADLVHAGGGNDTVDGKAGNDVITGDAGNDSLDGGVGNDTVEGGAGNDVFLSFGSNSGADHYDGGDGVDTVDYRGLTGFQFDQFEAPGIVFNLTTNIFGGAAAGDSWESIERVYGSNAHKSVDDMTGGAGVDNFFGFAGHDFLRGMGGNDLLDGGGGNDLLDGGDGFDTADYRTMTKAINIDLTANTFGGNALGDSFISIERVYASNYADTLIGDATANTFHGFGGNDALSGMAGDDRLAGGAGGDTLDGGAGTDIADYTTEGATVIDMATGSHGGAAAGDTLTAIEKIFGSVTGADSMIGGNGADGFYGFGGNDTLAGGGGDDVLGGGLGADRLDGGAGFDTADYRGEQPVVVYLATGQTGMVALGDVLVSIEAVYGSDFGADKITGNALTNYLYGFLGSDILDGGAGKDLLMGGADNDRLLGGDAADKLFGEAGHDRLEGGTGDDLLYGGGGADSFVFNNPVFGADRIRDFEDTVDRIRFEGFGAAADNFDDLVITNNATTNVQVEVLGQIFTVESAAGVTLSVTDFVFI